MKTGNATVRPMDRDESATPSTGSPVVSNSRTAILFAHIIERQISNRLFCPATFAAIDRLAHVAGCRGKAYLMLNRFRGQPTPFTVAQFQEFMRTCGPLGQNYAKDVLAATGRSQQAWLSLVEEMQ
jgi:hypothetical protein